MRYELYEVVRTGESNTRISRDRHAALVGGTTMMRDYAFAFSFLVGMLLLLIATGVCFPIGFVLAVYGLKGFWTVRQELRDSVEGD